MPFVIPPNAKVAIGLGAAIVGAFTAYQAAQDGLDLTEEYANNLGEKISDKIKRKDTPPPLVE